MEDAIQAMEMFQEPCPSSLFNKTLLQLRMKLDKFSEGITRLLAAFNELLVRRKIIMYRPRSLTIDHAGTGLLKSIAQLDVFHPVNEKFFVEATNVEQR